MLQSGTRDLSPAWSLPRRLAPLLALTLSLLAARPSIAAKLPPEPGLVDTTASATRPRSGNPRLGVPRPTDAPDIFGFGKVTRAGNVWMKTTNIGVMGNPYTEISSDPACQWPGPSGVEYLYYVGLWVGAVDPTTTEPALRRRVSNTTEWRPRSLDPVDHIYETSANDASGQPYVDDDHDGKLDEDPKNGIDDDGDGLIDEDGQNAGDQGFNCVMRDDTPQAIQAATQEAHVPLGLQVRQTTYAFSGPELRDVDYVSQEIENVSGHDLDSVYVAYFVDQDVGPVSDARYFSDDIPEPQVPQGPDPSVQPVAWDDPLSPNAPYREVVDPSDPLYQPVTNGTLTTGRCSEDTLFVRGFTMTDDDGDGGRTPGASTFLLIDHPTDLTGTKAPPHVGFRMYNYYTPGLTFAQGGLPTNDLERYAVISSQQNVDPITGLITLKRPDLAGDYMSICSVGPFLHMKAGDRITVVWAMAVQNEHREFPRDDRRHRYADIISNSIAAVLGYRGTLQHLQQYIPTPDGPGRETPLRALPGQEYTFSDCRDLAQRPFPNIRQVTSTADTWFDLDCNYCTGVSGYVYRHWVTGHPPPNANLKLIPEDHRVLVQWDNLPEYSPDPDMHSFDFKGYRVWKASNWKRPNDEIGPDESLWELLGSYYWYDKLNPLVERVVSPAGDTTTVKTSDVLVNRNWLPGNPLPRLIHASPVPCVPRPAGSPAPAGAMNPQEEPCDYVSAIKHALDVNGSDYTINDYHVFKYGIGRWQLEDPLVLNGFVYFYSVTAFDSSGRGSSVIGLEGRRAALQNDAVVPQAAYHAASDGGRAYVVPNPYRGKSSWDLAPNAIDPTGTHVDFMNLPRDWLLVKIYTLSGDLVQQIRATDMRVDGHPQKETPDDQQATWDLLSRNGQDVVSGIYLFSVETDKGERQQGRFVIIR
jgi:hypothetical protein